MLLLAGMATATTATFLAGLWDVSDARNQTVAAWRSAQDWMCEQTRPLDGRAVFDEDSIPNATVTDWQITLRTGASHQAELAAADVSLRTEFGSLRIPLQDVFMVVPQSDPPIGLRRQIALLIDQLNADDTQVVRGAVEQLVQIGPDAVAQLEQAENDQGLKVARIATEILARIRDDGGFDAETVEGDLVVTRFFAIRGDLIDVRVALSNDTGVEPVAWNQVRRLCRREFVSAADALTPPSSKPPGAVAIETGEETIIGQLLDSRLDIETPFGLLNVPAESIVSFQRTDDGLLRAAEQATYEVLRAESAESQTAAIAALGQAGPAAVITLQRVASCEDSRLAQQAVSQLHNLAQNGHVLVPLPCRVTTIFGDLGGTVRDQSLSVQTRRGSIERVDLASIHRIQPHMKAPK